jgi:hypothetical protein
MTNKELYNLVFENYIQAKRELIREGYLKTEESKNIDFNEIFSRTKGALAEKKIEKLQRENQMLKEKLSQRRGLKEEATTSWSKMMRGVNDGGSGPWSIIVISYGKVIYQHINIKIKDSLPAHYEEMKRKYPNANIHIEDKGGQVVWSNKK